MDISNPYWKERREPWRIRRGVRASRWNGKIDHVSRLNNISEMTAESRGNKAYVYWIFFFSHPIYWA